MPAAARSKILLTQRRVDQLVREPDPKSITWDEKQPGLGLRATSWVVRVHPKGGKRTIVVVGRVTGPGALSLADARVEAEKRAAKIRAGEGGPSRVATVASLAAHYLDHHRSRKKGRLAGEDRDTKRRAKLLVERWGKRRIDAIRHEDVAALCAAITGRGSPYEANRTRALIRSMWNEARVWGFISAAVPNPTAGTRPNREAARDVPALDVPQIRSVLLAAAKVADPWAGAAIGLLCLTGARKAEVLALKWSDVDLDRGVWRLRDRKAGDDLVLPLSGPAVELLRNVERIDGQPWVFVGRGKEGHLADLRAPWAEVVKGAKLPAKTRIHDLRGALATAVAGAVGIKGAQHLLGHADPRTTLRYIRPKQEDERRALEGFAAAVAGKGAA